MVAVEEVAVVVPMDEVAEVVPEVEEVSLIEKSLKIINK